jgi:tRNA-dihydrouridine synthase B
MTRLILFKMTFKIMLAPMEKITTSKFRELCYQNGADLVFTEMTRIEALARNNKSALKRIINFNNVPTVIQLIGKDEKALEKFISEYKPEPGFQGFDLNFGCPSLEFVKLGMGSAMMKRIAKINRLIAIIKVKGYTVSIKMRLGLNKFEKEKKVYLNTIKETNADYYIIHARHGKQNSDSPADFSVYPECVQTGKPIIANGDIKTKEQIDYLKKIGCAGAMIGREAIKNSKVFNLL